MAIDPDAVRRSLGLKPRLSTRDALRGLAHGERASSSRAAPEPEPAPEEKSEPITDPRKKPVGKLPVDAQRLLRNFYMLRPEVDLPPFVHQLDGSWGRYFGDGRPEREIQVGFKPAYVLFTVPLYPNGGPKWVMKKGSRSEGELVDPGLHDQPPLTERGFEVGIECNQINDQCIYIAWKDDGSRPAEPPPEEKASADESPREARRREQVEKRKKDLEERRKRSASRRR